MTSKEEQRQKFALRHIKFIFKIFQPFLFPAIAGCGGMKGKAEPRVKLSATFYHSYIKHIMSTSIAAAASSFFALVAKRKLIA